MKEINSLMTNTTSLVGYIAVLMIAGSYLGGSATSLEPLAMKGSVLEGYQALDRSRSRFVTVTIEGRQYRAELIEEIRDAQRSVREATY